MTDKTTAPRTIVVSHGLWQTALGARPDIVGQSVLLDGRPHVVGGILPRGFTDAEGADVYRPLPLSPDPSDGEAEVRDLLVTARLRRGFDVGAVRTELRLLALRLANARPATHGDWSVDVEPLWDARFAPWRASLTAGLMALSALAVLALTNLSNLAYAFVAQRSQQFTLMAVLGARRRDLVSACLFQCSGPLGLGVSLGLVCAVWCNRLTTGLVPADLLTGQPFLLTSAVAATITLASAALGCLAAITRTFRAVARAHFALATGRVPGLRHDGPWRQGLIVLQTAMAVVLGVLSVGTLSILMHQYRTWHQVSSGDAVFAEVHLPIGQYRKRTQVAEFFERLTALLNERPNVHASVIERTPFAPPMLTRVIVPGRDRSVTARHHAMSPNGMSLMNLRLVAGRQFAAQDTFSAHGVALMNVPLANRIFGGAEQAVHQRVTLSAEDGEYEVVGVLDDNVRPSETDSERMAVYRPFAQHPLMDAVVVVKGPRTAAESRALIQQSVVTLDASVAVPRVSTMAELRDRAFRSERVTAMLLLSGAAIAGIVSLAGLYALTSLASFSRRAELVVRSALGATPTDLVRLLARNGLTLTGAGVGLGLLVSYLVAALAAPVFPPDTLSAAAALVPSMAICLASGLAVLWPAARLCRKPATSYRLLQ